RPIGLVCRRWLMQAPLALIFSLHRGQWGRTWCGMDILLPKIYRSKRWYLRLLMETAIGMDGWPMVGVVELFLISLVVWLRCCSITRRIFPVRGLRVGG